METNRVYIIAEAGINHNGSLKLAREMVKVAADFGADAIKFQTFKAERVISRLAPKADYQLKNTEQGESQLEMVKKLELNESEHRILAMDCISRGIEFLSTPFDLESVDLLIALGVARIKISSGDVTNAALLLKAAQTQKPIILSTGMSTLEELKTALGVVAYGYLLATNQDHKPSADAFQWALKTDQGQAVLRNHVCLLHCTTEYPTPFEDVNLRAMDTLHRVFGLKVGYSDHTRGIVVPVAAVSRGAAVIEKHFTLDKNLPGPDHSASIEPDELKAMVASIRQVQQLLGTGEKKPAPSEVKNISIARRSLVTLERVNKGEIFTEKNLGAKRPGTGISAILYYDWLGRQAQRDYQPDEMLEP